MLSVPVEAAVSRATRLFLGALGLVAAGMVAAGDLGGQHPAVLLQADVAALKHGVNPDTFIPAHPARLAWRAGHANRAHPAVTVAARGAVGIDANAYLVQPPAATQWRLAGAAEGGAPALAQATR